MFSSWSARITIVQVLCSFFLTAQTDRPEFSPAIEDNSFFIEEAYNQEPGVVQHIWNVQRVPGRINDFNLSLTEEWPLFSQEHQLSYTLPYAMLEGPSRTGVGDIQLNYRYQWTTGEDWAAFSPRLTFIVPTGSAAKGTGAGSSGVQVNLPVSKRIGKPFVVHVNAGATSLFGVEGTDAAGRSSRHTLTSANVGGSLIWLASERFNVMVEGGVNRLSEIDDAGAVAHATQVFVSPGFRYAVDIGDLQIVPGAAIPFTRTDGFTEAGIFVYLSFEHPF